jgi:hypothetical protein
MNNYQRPYYPRRPVKSFQDLEVYQKLLAVSVTIAKRITLGHKLVAIALNLPLLIAAAHSIRFSDQLGAIAKLEEVMLDCNILIVYLEQYRDLENSSNVIPDSDRESIQIESEFFEEQIKTILTTRMKIMHLQMSWKKFVPQSGILLRRTKLNEDNAGGKNV